MRTYWICCCILHRTCRALQWVMFWRHNLMKWSGGILWTNSLVHHSIHSGLLTKSPSNLMTLLMEQWTIIFFWLTAVHSFFEINGNFTIWKILDMCASPGGKTTHLATLMRNTGTVIACDRTYRKVKAVVNVCEEFHLTNVIAVVADSRCSVLKGEQFKVWCVSVVVMMIPNEAGIVKYIHICGHLLM